MSRGRSQSYTLSDSKVFAAEELRLRLQAEKLFELEKASLSAHGLRDGMKILDLGCGNGFFLSQLAGAFPNCSLHGVDRNPKLLERAQEFCPQAGFSVLDLGDVGALKKVCQALSPDLIYLRYVLQHLSAPEIGRLMKALGEVGKPVLLMDCDDREIAHHPASEAISFLIRRKMEKQASLGGDRTVGARLGEILSAAGFTRILEKRLTFSSRDLGWKSFEEILLPVLKSGMPAELNAAEAAQVLEAEAWYGRAPEDAAYFASFGSIHVSGRKAGE